MTLATLLTMLGGAEAQAQSLDFDMVSVTVHATAVVDDVQALADYLLLTGALDGPGSGGPGDVVERLLADEIDIHAALQTTGFDLDQVCAVPVQDYTAGMVSYQVAADQCTALAADHVALFDGAIVYLDLRISNGF